MSDWLASADVRARAAEAGISEPMLARLGREGLIARPRPRGQGRGCGAVQVYPPRVVDQLAAVALARRYWRSVVPLRHHVWWTGGPLEDWPRWRRDRVRDLRRMSAAFAWYEAQDEAARDAAIIDFARHLVSGRRRWTPRTLRGAADRQSALTWVMEIATSGDVPLNLDYPIDDDGDLTAAELLERAFGLDRQRGEVPGPAGRLVQAALGLLPDPREAPWRMAQLTEEEAVLLRDGLRAWEALGLMPALAGRLDLAGPLILAVQTFRECAAADRYSPTRNVDFRGVVDLLHHRG